MNHPIFILHDGIYRSVYEFVVAEQYCESWSNNRVARFQVQNPSVHAMKMHTVNIVRARSECSCPFMMIGVTTRPYQKNDHHIPK